MTYLGGEKTVGDWLEVRGHVQHSWMVQGIYGTKRHIALGHGFLRWVRQGILQFVFVKPATAVVALVLWTKGMYHEGSFNPKDGYLYVSIINNLSVTLSLYCLVLFYVSCESILKPFRPLSKFLSVKSVVFFSYWQSCSFQVLFWFGVLHSQRDAEMLQGLFICIEMFFAALALHLAFPFKEYIPDKEGRSPIARSYKQGPGFSISSRPGVREYVDDDTDDDDDAGETSQLIPKLFQVLDGRDIIKDGKEVFLDRGKTDAELSVQTI
eukprot:CAMPEP_0203760664 /NCGR_PEP_ID=MMETSP0098-20131031/13914_1 /ASSEMBLY_ACC=CAM_ASM_000208 /TAXON_ID=96639 /ORGANISM=" , Strain NY0313808BC1" /LENGTH=266 /DNA_ID=CAMNT_0050654335 /DNA_START=356 /DNA_END=1156 /DNA_ORIENTATION=+